MKESFITLDSILQQSLSRKRLSPASTLLQPFTYFWNCWEEAIVKTRTGLYSVITRVSISFQVQSQFEGNVQAVISNPYFVGQYQISWPEADWTCLSWELSTRASLFWLLRCLNFSLAVLRESEISVPDLSRKGFTCSSVSDRFSDASAACSSMLM